MSAPSFKLRPALPADAETLTRIAHDAKRHWGYPEHWIQHWHADLTVSPDYLTHNAVFVAEQEGEAIAFYALVIKDGKAELDHLWVAPTHIGTGVGKALFVHAMQDAAAREISEVQISSDPNAEGFYSKMGAYRIGETISEIDGQRRSLPLMNVKPG
ncbi:MAG TPA: GNAT family N-acetyltransferase [Pyrinomonadaceae bacterium]|nr:GNAT family N-acetyltransferase [Pyrinomonadaceae bacterium]